MTVGEKNILQSPSPRTLAVFNDFLLRFIKKDLLQSVLEKWEMVRVPRVGYAFILINNRFDV